MNIKKIIASVMAGCIVCGGVPSVVNFSDNSFIASAEDEAEYTEGTYEELTYKNYGDYIEISGCDKEATEVEIPAEIDGVPVTIIGNNAFRGCSSLTSIVISDSITKIDFSAFYMCVSLKSITIPNSVTTIGASAFFYCSALTSITIPNSVINIESWAFIGTPWLEEKQKENPLVVVNNILIDGRACLGDIIIPKDVTSIGDSAFYGDNFYISSCKVESIIIPDSVTKIGIQAFTECSNLIEITIPNSVTSIERYAFHQCTDLTSIKILNSECEIYDNLTTISNGYDNGEWYFNGTIYGYENSTAQTYAEKYGRKFESLGESPAKELSTGDINGDNKIDASDSSLVITEYSTLSVGGEGTFSEDMKKFADVNGDGLIDSVDSSLILGYYSYTSTGGTDTIEDYLTTI